MLGRRSRAATAMAAVLLLALASSASQAHELLQPELSHGGSALPAAGGSASQEAELLQPGLVGGGAVPAAGTGSSASELLQPGLGGGAAVPAAGTGLGWPPAPHAVVSKQCGVVGGGAAPCYATIGAALEQAPVQMPEEDKYVVHVLKGVYDESFNVTTRNVYLIGEGIGVTVITGNKSNGTGTPMNLTATVNAMAHGFVAQDLTIRNTAGRDMKQAVALRSNSNKSVVFRCSLEGYEDTLYAENGLQLYLESYIYGTVDFVFGNAQAMFQRCSLFVRRPPEGKHNVVTAQGCNNHSRESGFSFQECSVDAAPGEDLGGVETYLGRPYRNFSHVAFIQSYLGGVVSAGGWVSWDKAHVVKETTETVKYTEYGNVGPGANTNGRVKWPGLSLLTHSSQALPYTADVFINASVWVPPPIAYNHGLGVAPRRPRPPRA